MRNMGVPSPRAWTPSSAACNSLSLTTRPSSDTPTPSTTASTPTSAGKCSSTRAAESDEDPADVFLVVREHRGPRDAGADGRASTLPARPPLQVERQKVLQDVFVVDLLRPAVGGEHGPVQGGVGILKPRGALVVQVRQRPLLQLRLVGPLGVEPVAPHLVQPAGGLGDGLHASIALRLPPRRPRQRERLEAGGWGVAGSIL